MYHLFKTMIIFAWSRYLEKLLHTKVKLLRKWIALVLQEKIHGLPSKSKCPSDRKHSVVVIIAVNSISFQETAIYRERYLANIFLSVFL